MSKVRPTWVRRWIARASRHMAYDRSSRAIRPLGRWALGLLAAAPMTAVAGPPAPVHTSRTQFNIPFEFDASRLEEIGAREVVLFVSQDGSRWSRGGQCPLTQSSLLYSVTDDGPYLFALRVRTDENTLIPAGPMEPSLSVVVDRTPPTLAISLLTTEGNQPRLVWHSDDETLDASTLRIESSRDGVRWSPVDVRPAASGQTELPIPADGSQLVVRATIADAAGNIGRATATGTAPSATAPRMPRQTASLGSGTPQIRPAERPFGVSQLPSIQPGSVAEAPGNTARLTTRSYDTSPTHRTSLPPRAAANLPADIADSYAPPAGQTAFGASAFADIARQASTGAPVTAPAPQIPSPADAMVASRQPTMPAEYAPRYPDEPEMAPLDPASMKLPENYAMSTQPPEAVNAPVRVNALGFNIEYALQQVGHSGVNQVDCYITEDGGRHWFYYGRDDDSQSPFDIAVPREGRYGFSFRVQNGAGIAAHPPQPSEQPDVRVEVDATAPAVQLMAIEPIGGQHSGEILVQWKASDRELLPRPIELEWSENPTGPWMPIATELPNTGRHRWRVPKQMPPAVYVKLAAADTCGNRSETVSPRPVVVDFSRPSLRVLKVAAPK